MQFRYKCIHTLKCSLLLGYIKRAKLIVNNSDTAGMCLPWHDEVIKVNAQLHRQRKPGIQHTQSIVTHIVTQVYSRVGIALINLATSSRERGHTLNGYCKIQCQ